MSDTLVSDRAVILTLGTVATSTTLVFCTSLVRQYATNMPSIPVRYYSDDSEWNNAILLTPPCHIPCWQGSPLYIDRSCPAINPQPEEFGPQEARQGVTPLPPPPKKTSINWAPLESRRFLLIVRWMRVPYSSWLVSTVRNSSMAGGRSLRPEANMSMATNIAVFSRFIFYDTAKVH